MYYTIYELLNELFFNSAIVEGSLEANACTLGAFALTLMFAYIPFRALICFVNTILDWRR